MQLKFLTASHPKSSLPFPGVIMKHELSSMKAFVILAESSSFNNAAKLLNITQPALTRRIKKMEEDLHIQLFERTTRKVTLTKAGKRLLPEARELIKKFDETLFNIRDMNAYHRGMVTLACIPTAVFYFLPLAIGKFNELYPNIKVRILEQGTNNCMESVLCNESDFGINMNNVTNSSIDFTPLVNEPFVLACRRDHPLAKKQLVEWQELVGYKMIGVRSSSGNRLLIEQQLADKPWKLDWFYEVRHLSTSLGLVEAGLGISALPGLAMPHAPYSSIIGIPLVEPVIRRTLGIIRRKDAVLSPAAERFFALLINLWTDDKDNLWTNIVERQRHALQEIG
ncbi:LysR family transcriptional regulator YbhD [Escherichia coli O157:H7 str. SS52]|nr:putative transcriptional regulator LYSR-type [Escherichia coli O157:H7 str. EDL933]ACI86406.1 putative transcriptional regulator LYSR-type [Escherichia coli]ADD55538.1 putative transcriptional regulator LYSR-type [Escherichia coli O55:H7 str. CB9615]AIF92393.1 LysR family transcriptional regulator YbhD [Escherichia coli O157:H7 str. SS17]AJA24757.1 LysR family transcriptional regulator YbhD [Escherichia coli O157:H7 str. SS52]EDU31991.1 transcriptional regulator, LysR family [Escherichia co